MINKIRIIINLIIILTILPHVLNGIKHFNMDIYYLLWGGQILLISMIDTFFLFINIFEKPKMVDTSLIAVISSFLGSTLLFLIHFFHDVPVLTSNLKAPGIILNVFICPLVLWALMCLRNCLSVIPEANKVVSKGIYKYSRHPLYVCYSLWGISYIFMFTSIPVIIICISHILFLYIRLRLEEKVLLKSLSAYEDYYKQTGLINLPFLKIG